MKKFKEGDRVYVQAGFYSLIGIGTVMRREGKCQLNGHVFVRLIHHYNPEYPNDNHSVPIEYVRLATKLDKILE